MIIKIIIVSDISRGKSRLISVVFLLIGKIYCDQELNIQK